MRVDKFLWCVRIYKSRKLASEACSKDRILVNKVTSKASKDVMEGDHLTVKKDQILYEYEILQVPKSRLGAKLVPLHLNNITTNEQLELLELRRTARDYYREKGTGRPTKKDRRGLTDFLDNTNP